MRPRNPDIDAAVLRATTELLEEVGYLDLTIAAVAERAGTTKPAIYRRWPTKAHLVHEAVFPADTPEVLSTGDDLPAVIRALVETGLATLGRPAARAALPGLLAEMSGNTEVLERFAIGPWAALAERLEQADVSAAMVVEVIAGAVFMATTMRSTPVDAEWTDALVDLIMRGIEGEHDGSRTQRQRRGRDRRQQGDGASDRRSLRR